MGKEIIYSIYSLKHISSFHKIYNVTGK